MENTMKQLSRMLVEKACEYSDVKLYENYSGRGMFGKTCFGITTSGLKGLCKFILQFDNFSEAAYDLVDVVQYDSMGHDMIYYFPGFELSED